MRRELEVTDPMDVVETKKGMRDMAVMTRAYYEGLLEAGFSPSDALSLAAAWIRGVVSSGKSNE